MNLFKAVSDFAVLAVFSILASAPICAESTVQEPSEVDGKQYVRTQAENFFKKFIAAYTCVDNKLPEKSDSPEALKRYMEMDDCRNLVTDYVNARINADGKALNSSGEKKDVRLRFVDQKAKDSILKEIAVIHSYHLKLVGLFNQLNQLSDKSSMTTKMVRSMGGLVYWYNNQAKDYRKKLTKISGLVEKYRNLKSKCRIYSDYAECDRHTLKEMADVLESLGQYFEYRTGADRVRAYGKGLFLYDLDRHAGCFMGHLQEYLIHIDSLLSNYRQRQRELNTDPAILKFSTRAFLFELMVMKTDYPGKADFLVTKAIRSFSDLYDFTKNLPNTDIGKFLNQEDIGRYTIFSKSDDKSNRFSKSIANELKKILLNTRDKDGNPLKHEVTTTRIKI